MSKHYTYNRIEKVKKKILSLLVENESSGVSLIEILEKIKEEKELLLTALNNLLDYNALVVMKGEKYYFEA